MIAYLVPLTDSVLVSIRKESLVVGNSINAVYKATMKLLAKTSSGVMNPKLPRINWVSSKVCHQHNASVRNQIELDVPCHCVSECCEPCVAAIALLVVDVVEVRGLAEMVRLTNQQIIGSRGRTIAT